MLMNNVSKKFTCKPFDYILLFENLFLLYLFFIFPYFF